LERPSDAFLPQFWRLTNFGSGLVFNDVSKLKALEADKRRAERLAEFEALVSGIAHEIKNPLVAIKTFAELLPERFQEPEFRDDFSKVVVNEIDRIDDLVARLRALAAPSLQIGATSDICEAISNTLTLLRGQFEKLNIRVTSKFGSELPPVAVDRAQLKQLFLNIFLNAIDAMCGAGEISVRVSQRPSEDGPRVMVEVQDTGPGIPDAIRDKIFSPFFSTKPRGAGLGLAICRGIVDAHQGVVRAECAPGQRGANIIVEFPSAPGGPLPRDAASRCLGV
jgi:signal transduction histidine kinase